MRPVSQRGTKKNTITSATTPSPQAVLTSSARTSGKARANGPKYMSKMPWAA